jgi:hypothetical protein
MTVTQELVCWWGHRGAETGDMNMSTVTSHWSCGPRTRTPSIWSKKWPNSYTRYACCNQPMQMSSVISDDSSLRQIAWSGKQKRQGQKRDSETGAETQRQRRHTCSQTYYCLSQSWLCWVTTNLMIAWYSAQTHMNTDSWHFFPPALASRTPNPPVKPRFFEWRCGVRKWKLDKISKHSHELTWLLQPDPLKFSLFQRERVFKRFAGACRVNRFFQENWRI